ncbi:TetR/AcrR family transcriptional regulator [Fusibacter bizertensis]
MTDRRIHKNKIKFHKDAFDKTSEERRNSVLSIALGEFASKGYSATSINDIARDAGVSIGAMYSYFASKEDLFLTIVNEGHFLMVEILSAIGENSSDVFDCVKKMITSSRTFALEHTLLNQIYLDLTTQALSPLAVRLSSELEQVTPVLLSSIIDKAKAEGLVSEHVDAKMASFCIDNILMIYQFSFSSDYYKERMRMYLGDEELTDIEKVEAKMMQFIKRAILL